MLGTSVNVINITKSIQSNHCIIGGDRVSYGKFLYRGKHASPYLVIVLGNSWPYKGGSRVFINPRCFMPPNLRVSWFIRCVFISWQSSVYSLVIVFLLSLSIAPLVCDFVPFVLCFKYGLFLPAIKKKSGWFVLLAVWCRTQAINGLVYWKPSKKHRILIVRLSHDFTCPEYRAFFTCFMYVSIQVLRVIWCIDRPYLSYLSRLSWESMQS